MATRIRSLSPTARDRLGVCALLVVGLAALLLEPVDNTDRTAWRAADGWGVALMFGMLLPLALRRRAPLACLVVPGACALLAFNLGYAATVGVLAVWAATGSAALYTDRPTTVGLTILGGVAVGGSVWLSAPSGDSPLTILGATTAGLLPPLVGDALRRTREHARELERARAAELEYARVEERLRIARDVHDAVGHHLSAISLQAAAGQLAPDAAADALQHIDRLSGRALQETREILGLLRAGDDETPAPTLADLEPLIGDARRSGIAVTAHLDPAAAELSPQLQAVAYRVAQEALTNVRRHARPPIAHVDVRRDHDHLVVEICDLGGAHAAVNATAGHGIAGMRERAELVGGRLDAGPADDGGWRVALTVPVAG